jgi:hypothetical protein
MQFKASLRGSHCVYSPHAPNNIATAIQYQLSPFGDTFKADKSKGLLIHARKKYVELETMWLHSLSTLVLERTSRHHPQPNKNL